MNSSCANWLIPFLPTVVYYPVVLLFICEKTKTIVQFLFIRNPFLHNTHHGTAVYWRHMPLSGTLSRFAWVVGGGKESNNTLSYYMSMYARACVVANYMLL